MALTATLAAFIMGSPCPGQERRSTDVTFWSARQPLRPGPVGRRRGAQQGSHRQDERHSRNPLSGLGRRRRSTRRAAFVSRRLTDTQLGQLVRLLVRPVARGLPGRLRRQRRGPPPIPSTRGTATMTFTPRATGVVPAGIIDRNTQRPGSINVSGNGLHYPGTGTAFTSSTSTSTCARRRVQPRLPDPGLRRQRRRQRPERRDLSSLRPGRVCNAGGRAGGAGNAYHEAIEEDHNVVGIFYGHSHMTQYKLWKGSTPTTSAP